VYCAADRAAFYGFLRHAHTRFVEGSGSNDETLGLVTSVASIGSVHKYPTPAHAQYCIVRLRPFSKNLHGVSEGPTYILVLYDDQVHGILVRSISCIAYYASFHR
jgi:hypothetical protein